jgi:acetylornithine deacetylase/succinyl-diaminopimelate desuccinylase-like protein
MIRLASAGIFVCVIVTLIVVTSAQQGPDIGARLMQDAAVKAAVQAARDDEPQTIEDQIRLCEIPAPPFKETVRGKAYADAFRALGLKNVRVDKEGNVLGERPGAAPKPHLVFTAHLDTVFPEETDVTVKREGTILRPGHWRRLPRTGRGAGRDSRDEQGERPDAGHDYFRRHCRGRGTRRPPRREGALPRHAQGTGRSVRLDRRHGPRHHARRRRQYRVVFKGPGGHSYGAFGLANPIHALGRAMAKIGDFQVPREPKTTFNVGRIGGGTSVNSIPFESWMEVDMRSADQASLKSVDANFHKAVDTALAEENERWSNNGRLTVEKNLVGDRAAGRTPADSPIVEATVSVTKVLGFPVTLEARPTRTCRWASEFRR